MKKVLNNLFEYKSLSRQEAKDVLMSIATEQYNPSQVAAFMSVYLMRAITVEELSGFRDAMLEMCLKVKFESEKTLDIVGTGGDGKNTFNISTLSCFVVAGAGIKVTKHGNYGVSSISGSSNVLEALGYIFSSDNDVLSRELDEAGICFLHAPLFHPAMKSVAPIRKELGVRTFFNMLGPVVNPCFPSHQLLGVYNLEMARLYNYLLQDTSVDYSIVHSLSGYDEISLTSAFKLLSKEKEQLINPSDLGLLQLEEEALYGGVSVKEAAALFVNVLEGKGTAGQNAVVIINAAVAIHTFNNKLPLDECIQKAKESLESKKAFNILRKLIKN